jgi:hypothetical protein
LKAEFAELQESIVDHLDREIIAVVYDEAMRRSDDWIPLSTSLISACSTHVAGNERLVLQRLQHLTRLGLFKQEIRTEMGVDTLGFLIGETRFVATNDSKRHKRQRRPERLMLTAGDRQFLRRLAVRAS